MKMITFHYNKHTHAKLIVSIALLCLACYNTNSQNNSSLNQINQSVKKVNSSASETSFTTLSIGIGAFLYLINPIVLYEDKKIYAGITKELSVGFGNFGQNRIALEYSFVFTGNITHHIRFSYKYDLLLKTDIEPSHNLQGTSVLSLGAGYFTNFNKQGFFPELSFGYSLRNHKLLIFPHIKIRHTFMFSKQESDITDISFGIILGFANPFINLKIKRHY